MCANPLSCHPSPTASANRLAGGGLLALAALALLGAAAPAQPDKADAEIRPDVRHFRSGDKDIRAECFAPPGPGKHPVLVGLPGVNGIDAPDAGYRAAARAAAGQGYVVLLVHYFDRTGAAAEDMAAYGDLFRGYFRRKEHTAEQARRMKELLDSWAEVVKDAVAYARTLPNGDGERVGLVGFSLGGALALTAAARHDLKLAALVELFGTLPPELRRGLKKLPPTLIIHGEEDAIVPVEEAYLLIGLLSARKLPHEAEVYPGVAHMFLLDGKTLQVGAMLSAKGRTDAFLTKHLKPGKIAK
jgi:carboxymethylenebutenolidase